MKGIVNIGLLMLLSATVTMLAGLVAKIYAVLFLIGWRAM